MYAMRPLRNFKTNQCCHLISRIANRAFFLNDEEDDIFRKRHCAGGFRGSDPNGGVRVVGLCEIMV